MRRWMLKGLIWSLLLLALLGLMRLKITNQELGTKLEELEAREIQLEVERAARAEAEAMRLSHLRLIRRLMPLCEKPQLIPDFRSDQVVVSPIYHSDGEFLGLRAQIPHDERLAGDGAVEPAATDAEFRTIGCNAFATRRLSIPIESRCGRLLDHDPILFCERRF